MTRSSVVAACFAVGVAASVLAQPGDRNAIVYGARLAGTSDPWTFGSLAAQSAGATPIDIQIAVFMFRDQGIAFSTAVWSAYIDCLSTDQVQIPGSGRGNGCVEPFDYGGVTTAVFTNRNAGISGSGFRISNAANLADAGNAGGISIKQDPPVDRDGNPNPGLITTDGPMVYTFNITANCDALNSPRDLLVRTPFPGGSEPSRITGVSVYNNPAARTTTSVTNSTTSDSMTIHVSWVPAPGAAPVLALCALAASRRRRTVPA